VPPVRLFLLCCLLLLCFAGSGFWLYRQQRQALINEHAENLHAIAQLKTSQLLAWRQERLADARMNGSGMVRLLTLQWLQSGRQEILDDIRQRLQFFQDNEGYFNMILADARGRIQLSRLPRITELEQVEQQIVQQVVAEKQAVMGEFFYCHNCDRVHINVAAPILDGDRVVMVLLLVADPERDLYPIIRSWPIPHENAESLLVRRQGENALILNQPRHRTVPPLSQRLPLQQSRSPEVQAVLGTTGVFVGQDYRGTDVLTILNAIPATEWFMVTKLDLTEIVTQARYRAGGILLLVFMATVIAVTLAQLVSLSRRKALSEALLLEEQHHRQTREEIRATLYSIGEGVIATDSRGRVTRMNPVAETLTGWTESTALGQPLTAVYQVIDEESERPVPSPVERVLRNNTTVTMSNHTLLLARDTSRRPIADSGAPIRDGAGAITGVVLVVRDQTKRRAMEKARAESAKRYTDLVESISDFIWETDSDHRHTYASPRSLDLLGYAPQECIGLTWFDLLSRNNTSEALQTFTDLVARLQPYSQLCLSCVHKDGHEVFLESSATPVVDPQGRFLGYRGVSRDVSERKHNEEAQKRLEEQLQQSQKMEMVGRLAGGIAHDFNNMLTVISSYVDMTLGELEEQHPLYKRLFEVHKAAQHSADLTRQLLAFARKQVIAPRILDLNETISAALKMLHRLIGEHIDLQWHPGAALWQVRMDSTQIGQILANLAVNARDAIHGPGHLLIQTANVVVQPADCTACLDLSPGDYVLLTVNDSGCGMDAETQAKIFEPFFTTKEEGRGTGLGLATVYGIVRQNHGAITVTSAPDQGATFSIYLPRTQYDVHARPMVSGSSRHRGIETILLVEDDAALLELGAYILEQQGYTVLIARSPSEALDVVRKYPATIHLLITDVIMPEMNGRDLARTVGEIVPAIRMLFMSGYTADILVNHGGVAMDTPFLEKPFTASQMALKVREVLDRG
jgi:PAS domain S-box-containing protein